MPFQYNPGVASTAAASFREGNNNLGMMIATVLSRLADAKDKKNQQTEVLKHQDRAGDAYVKALLAGVGGDKEKFTQQYGESPDAISMMGAGEKFDWMQGQVAGQAFKEKAAQFQSAIQQAAADKAGAAILPKVLATAKAMGSGGASGDTPSPTGDPTGSGAMFGQDTPAAAPDASPSKLFLSALSTLDPKEQQVFGQSSIGQKFISGVMQASEKDDLQMRREGAMDARNQAALDQKDRVLANRENEFAAKQNLADARTNWYKVQADAKGSPSPDQRIRSLTSLYNTQLSAAPFHKGDADFQAEMADTKSQLDAAVKGTKATGAAATTDRKAVGAYKIGTVYKGGLKYLGGDPKDPASWDQQQ